MGEGEERVLFRIMPTNYSLYNLQSGCSSSHVRGMGQSGWGEGRQDRQFLEGQGVTEDGVQYVSNTKA